ncbi:hypothetical protein RHMOL_Rhmol12G0068100 [Rhododendron molle]|uniref:Uncharacterized protein n=1 Tax=Rhododendron molle TaxID=49168 RepID=A0ACC0LFJ9_RHOML|nr:hypothetical protein RHMOL_Rhmol12G0068100 [Rhododendron molle]
MNDDLIRRLSLFLLSLEHLQQTGDISGEVNVESRCAQNWFPAASPDPRHLLPSLRLLATGSEDNYMSVNIHSKCAPIFFAFYVFDKMYERQMNDDEDAFDVLYCIAFALMDAQWLVMPVWNLIAFVYEGFLTDEECNHVISLVGFVIFLIWAKSELKRSAVADNESGKIKLSDVRTSSGMFIAKGKELVFHCSGPNGYWQDTHPPAGLKTWALPREGDHFEHNSILLLLHYWGLHVNGFIYIAALGPDEIWMLVLT